MNIFYLDKSPIKAAQDHCDKHVVKMILETAQLLSTAHRVLDGDEYADKCGLYRKTHVNHPCSIWVRESYNNYAWAIDLLTTLLNEYKLRYGKVHKTARLLSSLMNKPLALKYGPMTPIAQCMPDEYKNDDPVQAYRDYYIGEKAYMAKWNHSQQPKWFKIGENNE